jgi:hypothetical protein
MNKNISGNIVQVIVIEVVPVNLGGIQDSIVKDAPVAFTLLS